MKKILLYLLSISLLLLILRGPIYRQLVQYQVVGERQLIPLTDPELLAIIDQEAEGDIRGIQEIIHIGLQITNQTLHFTTGKASRNPNQLFRTQKANCIGYSALFHSVVHHLIHTYDFSQRIKPKHLIGKIHILGIDIHPLFDSPFFKDHDFNQLTDLETGKVYHIDPSVSDYLYIRFVTAEN